MRKRVGEVPEAGRGPMRSALGALALLLVLPVLGGCDDPTAAEDANVCRQTYEFGNKGCARITGLVREADGTPLEGVRMFPRYPEGRECCDGPVARTDSLGQFSFTIRWFGPGEPDTITTRVVASWRVQGSYLVTDSVPLTVDFVPVGSPPITHHVQLTLGRPCLRVPCEGEG